MSVRGLDCASTFASTRSGGSHPVSTPSPPGAWLGVASEGFADFESIHARRFRRGVQRVYPTSAARVRRVANYTKGQSLLTLRALPPRQKRPEGQQALPLGVIGNTPDSSRTRRVHSLDTAPETARVNALEVGEPFTGNAEPSPGRGR